MLRKYSQFQSKKKIKPQKIFLHSVRSQINQKLGYWIILPFLKTAVLTMNTVFLIKIYKKTWDQLMCAVSTLCTEETKCSPDQMQKRRRTLLM
jgi:hypothetical protein